MTDPAKPLLPVVQEEITENLKHHFWGNTDSDPNIRASQVLDRFRKDLAMIKQENPQIADVIGQCKNSSKDPLTVELCAVTVYLALRSQEEADRLAEQ